MEIKTVVSGMHAAHEYIRSLTADTVAGNLNWVIAEGEYSHIQDVVHYYLGRNSAHPNVELGFVHWHTVSQNFTILRGRKPIVGTNNSLGMATPLTDWRTKRAMRGLLKAITNQIQLRSIAASTMHAPGFELS